MRKITALPFGVPGCSLIPHKRSDDWWIDPGVRMQGVDPIPFVSATAIREIVKLCGEFVPVAEHGELATENEDLVTRVLELEAQVAELEVFAQAIDTIESRDFRARKKRGPKKEAVA